MPAPTSSSATPAVDSRGTSDTTEAQPLRRRRAQRGCQEYLPGVLDVGVEARRCGEGKDVGSDLKSVQGARSLWEGVEDKATGRAQFRACAILKQCGRQTMLPVCDCRRAAHSGWRTPRDADEDAERDNHPLFNIRCLFACCDAKGWPARDIPVRYP